MEKWLTTDLHIHTSFSDGTVPIEEVVRLYGEAGLDVIAITDHLFDTTHPKSRELYTEGKSIKDPEGYFKKIEEVAQWAWERWNLLVIPGLEVCNINDDYHILAIDLKKAVNPNQEASGVIDEIHRQGGLAIASHPPLKLSYFLQGDKVSIERHPLHLWNHRERYVTMIDAWEIANRDDLFDAVGLERLPHIANSDFHEPLHLNSWKSLVYAEKSKESIKKAILERRVALFLFGKGKETKQPFSTETPEAIPSEIEGETQMQNYGKILIVDDERDLVEMLSYNLRKKGHRTASAHDGFEAWNKLESEEPDLLILDLMMPGLDGWELCRLIRNHKVETVREAGILMLTARATEEDRVYGLNLGADDYLTKPFSLSEFLLRVEKMMEKRKKVRAMSQAMGELRREIRGKEVNLMRVVHDLKNPLLSMGMSAKLLLRREKTEEGARFLEIIHNSSAQLTSWVEDILKFPDLSSDRWKDEMRTMDLVSIAKGSVNSAAGPAREKEIELHFAASPPWPPVLCHEQLLRRAIDNLLYNALKYTPRGGRVEVSVTYYLAKGGHGVAEISVKDTGIGIPSEEWEKIFEPYYRGKNAETEGGLGLGLAFAKEVMDLHRGKILLDSALGKGSTFSILLPVSNSQKGTEVERDLA